MYEWNERSMVDGPMYMCELRILHLFMCVNMTINGLAIGRCISLATIKMREFTTTTTIAI